MKRNWKNFAIYAALTITALSLTGCGSKSDDNSPVTTENITTTEAAVPLLVLSIGTEDNMKNYDFFYESATPGSTSLSWDASNPDADMLIAIIEEVTGWNLTLAEPVSVSPGSFTIYFSEESSIYTGTVDSSKADFAITDRKQLTTTILDTIVANMNAAYNESLTIYFASADGDDIVVPGTDMTISSAEPYAEEVIEETVEE